MTESKVGSSDRNQIIYAQVIAKTWGDETYKAQLIAHPRQVLTDAGMILPESGTIEVLEDTESVHYAVLPQDGNLADFKDDMATAMGPLFPLSAEQQIIIRQVTEDVKYFVLPYKPDMPEIHQNAALGMVALADVSAANTNVVANAEAVANAVAANNAAAATTAAAAAEVVAVVGVVLI